MWIEINVSMARKRKWLFFLLVMMSGLETRALTCPQVHRLENAHQTAQAQAQLREWIASGFPVGKDAQAKGLLTNPGAPWLSGLPQNAPQMIEQISKIPASERSILIEEVKKVAPETLPLGSAQFRQVVLLALYDSPAWLATVSKFQDHPVEAQWMSYFIALVAENMPSNLRADVLNHLGQNYSNYSKAPPFPHGRQGSKRTVDFLFKVLLRGHERIESEISRGATPLQALDAHFKEVQSYIRSERPFRAQEVVEVARRIQQSFRENIHRWQNPGGAIPSLVLYGSFPNARASLRSDVDLAFNQNSLSAEIPSVLNQALKPYFEKITPGSALPVSLKKGDLTNGALHPVVIEIKTDSIELIVLHPRDPHRNRRWSLNP